VYFNYFILLHSNGRYMSPNNEGDKSTDILLIIVAIVIVTAYIIHKYQCYKNKKYCKEHHITVRYDEEVEDTNGE